MKDSIKKYSVESIVKKLNLKITDILLCIAVAPIAILVAFFALLVALYFYKPIAFEKITTLLDAIPNFSNNSVDSILNFNFYFDSFYFGFNFDNTTPEFTLNPWIILLCVISFLLCVKFEKLNPMITFILALAIPIIFIPGAIKAFDYYIQNGFSYWDAAFKLSIPLIIIFAMSTSGASVQMARTISYKIRKRRADLDNKPKKGNEISTEDENEKTFEKKLQEYTRYRNTWDSLTVELNNSRSNHGDLGEAIAYRYEKFHEHVLGKPKDSSAIFSVSDRKRGPSISPLFYQDTDADFRLILEKKDKNLLDPAIEEAYKKRKEFKIKDYTIDDLFIEALFGSLLTTAFISLSSFLLLVLFGKALFMCIPAAISVLGSLIISITCK